VPGAVRHVERIRSERAQRVGLVSDRNTAARVLPCSPDSVVDSNALSLAAQRPGWYRRCTGCYAAVRASTLTTSASTGSTSQVEGLRRCSSVKRRAASKRVEPPICAQAQRPLAMDFVSESTSDGYRLWIPHAHRHLLTWRALALSSSAASAARWVVRFLEEVAKVRATRRPSPSTTARVHPNALDQWLHAHGVTLHFTGPANLSTTPLHRELQRPPARSSA